MSTPCALFTSCSQSLTAEEVIRRKCMYSATKWIFHRLSDPIQPSNSLRWTETVYSALFSVKIVVTIESPICHFWNNLCQQWLSLVWCTVMQKDADCANNWVRGLSNLCRDNAVTALSRRQDNGVMATNVMANCFAVSSDAVTTPRQHNDAL